MPKAPKSERPMASLKLRPGLDSIGVELRQKAAEPENDVDKLQDLENRIQLSNDALQEAGDKLKEKEKQILDLIDDKKTKDRALRYAFTFLIVAPLICLGILIAELFFPINACRSGVCFWIGNPNFKIADLTQVALVSGPLILIVAILGFILKGVFPAKSSLDGATLPPGTFEQLLKMFKS
jgi:hypothetical protein